VSREVSFPRYLPASRYLLKVCLYRTRSRTRLGGVRKGMV